MMTTAETAAQIATAPDEPGAPQRILLVDDETAVLFAYRKLIEREGIAVDSSTSLKGALEYVKARPYLAVMTDLRLAGTDNMDGLEVVRFTRQVQPEARLICSTGYGSCELEQQVRKLGVSHYFEKPVLPATILELLKGLKSLAGTMVSGKSASCGLLAALWTLGN
jgi:DNA-binding NtrC family response regulator